MGTLVQAPDRTAVAVGSQQAIDRPAKGGGIGGLGTFLAGVLPTVNAELDKYDAATKARYRALGQVDELNNVNQEVGLLNRRNYAVGKQYQRTVNGQVLIGQKFQQRLDSIDPANFDADAETQVAHELSRESVDLVYHAELPDDVKAELYAANLKENAGYMSLIDKKVQRITADNVNQTRLNSNAKLLSFLHSPDVTPEELVTAFTSHRAVIKAGKLLVDANTSDEDINKAFEEDVKLVVDNAMSTLAVGEDMEANIKQMEFLAEAASQTEGVSILTSTAIREKLMKVKGEAINIADNLAERAVDEFNTQLRLDPNSKSEEDFNTLLAQMSMLNNLSPNQRTKLLANIQSMYVWQNNTRNSGETIFDPKNTTLTDADLAGIPLSELLKQAKVAHLKDDPELTGIGALGLIEQFSGLRSGEYYDKGVQEGSELLMRSILPVVYATTDASEGDTLRTHRNSNFAIFSQMYNIAAAGNGMAVSDLLAGVPDELKEIFISEMENGGTLEDVRRRAQSPVEARANYKGLKDARDKLTPEMFRIGQGWVKRTLAGATKVPKQMYDAHMNALRISAEESEPQLALLQDGDSPAATAAHMGKAFLYSNKYGFPPSYRNIRVAEKMRQTKSLDGAVMDEQFTADAEAGYRVALGQKYNVDPAHIVVKYNNTGEFATFDMYDITDDSSGVIRKGREQIQTSDILEGAQGLYLKATKRKSNPNQYPTQQEGHIQIGSGALADRASGKDVAYKTFANSSRIMGGNGDLTNKFVAHIAHNYGATMTPLLQDNGLTAYGVGGTSSIVPEVFRKRFKAAKTPDEVSRIQGDLFTYRLSQSARSKAVKAVAIPVPSAEKYPKRYEESLSLVYTAMYIYGDAGLYGDGKKYKGVTDAMNAKNYATGEALFKKTKMYDTSGKQPVRNKLFLEQLRKHYEAKRKLQ